MPLKHIEKRGKRKIDEKDFEQQMLDLIAQNQSGPATGSTISAYLLFRAAKRLERYSIFLLVITTIFAGSILLLGLVLAYYVGIIP